MIARVSLIPEQIQERRREHARRVRWTGAAALAAALSIVCVFASQAHRAAMPSGPGDAMARIERHVERVEAAVPELRSQVATARAAAGASTVLRDRPDWSLLLALLDSARGEGVTLERIGVTAARPDEENPEPGRVGRVLVEVTGFAPRQTDAQRFILEVERSGVFDSARSQGTRPRTLGSVSGVSFELSCEIAPIAVASGETP